VLATCHDLTTSFTTVERWFISPSSLKPFAYLSPVRASVSSQYTQSNLCSYHR
jgi:hypothetical protein